jgi:hypothetical protein
MGMVAYNPRALPGSFHHIGVLRAKTVQTIRTVSSSPKSTH